MEIPKKTVMHQTVVVDGMKKKEVMTIPPWRTTWLGTRYVINFSVVCLWWTWEQIPTWVNEQSQHLDHQSSPVSNHSSPEILPLSNSTYVGFPLQKLKRKLQQEAEVCFLFLNDLNAILMFCLQVPHFSLTPTIETEPGQEESSIPVQWPLYLNLHTIPGKALPIMLQSPEIKEILQKGILLILQHLVFKNGFPDDASRVKIIHHMIKEAARNLWFKDVVSWIHQEIGCTEPLTNMVLQLSFDILIFFTYYWIGWCSLMTTSAWSDTESK